jgi:hypothetical protein
MTSTVKPYTTLVDFVTGREVPNIGAEENRQAVERYLVEQKGYDRENLSVDVEIALDIEGEMYRSQLDLVVRVNRTRFMVISCVAGSLGSWERQTLAAARLLDDVQIPFAVVSDGKTASVLNTVSGKKIGEALEAIPSKTEARRMLASIRLPPLAQERRIRESLIFRTYDKESVNVQRRLLQ